MQTALEPTHVPAVTAPYDRRMVLDELFPEGGEFEAVRASIIDHGYYDHALTKKRLYVATQKNEDGQYEIIALAAVSRDPGKTQDYLNTIADYLQSFSSDRAKVIDQYWRIYKTEGIINNAVNKYASLLASGGTFYVRHARKGKSPKALELARTLLDYWRLNVNTPQINNVATAARGLKAVTEQGIRVCLVEGDFIARQVWTEQQIGSLGTFSMPMTIQTISTAFLEPVKGINGLGELWYWKPSKETLDILRGKGEDKAVVKLFKPLLDSDLRSQLNKKDKALLNPALLSHVKHRGSDLEVFGESFIEPAKLGLRYLRAVTNTDIVSMENAINRITVVMVGSADPSSPYSKTDVAQARAALMQSFFEEPSPSMTIVWSGDDVKVEKVEQADSVLDLSSRHAIGERKVILSLGIPLALMDGSTTDGKSSGWAAMLSASGMAEHLGTAFGNAWSVLGERLLFENGFEEIDLIYQFDRSVFSDPDTNQSNLRNHYITGVISVRTYLQGIGKDPDAEFQQKCLEQGLEPKTTLWKDAFMPLAGLQGQGAGVQGDPGLTTPNNGRTPNNQQPAPPAAPVRPPSPTKG